MINYQEIISSLTVEKVEKILDKLKIPYRDCGEYLLMPTVCHNEDENEASWKLYYYFNTKAFVCYTECGSQSIFKFLKNFYKARDIEYDWYNDIYCLVADDFEQDYLNNFSNHNKYQSKRDNYRKNNPKELPEYSSGVLDCFIKKYPAEWLSDGISKAAMDKFDILFSISQNKIIIPHYDVKGRLVGIRGRALDEWEIENVGKYAPIKVEQTWYKHPLSLNLYGLNFNKENIKKTGICYIVEAELFDLIYFSAYQRGHCKDG